MKRTVHIDGLQLRRMVQDTFLYHLHTQTQYLKKSYWNKKSQPDYPDVGNLNLKIPAINIIIIIEEEHSDVPEVKLCLNVMQNVLYLPFLNTSTKVTWHNFDDLVRQYYWFGVIWLVSLFRKFLSLYFDTPHNATVTILTSTYPIVCHKV